MPTVAELTTPGVVAAPPDASIADVAGLLREHDVPCVVLVQYDQIAGVVTVRDLERGLAAVRDPHTTAARELCRTDVVTVGTGMSAGEARKLLRDHALRAAPVVDAGGRVQGYCSLDDIDDGT